jgi:TonB-dependent receptor
MLRILAKMKSWPVRVFTLLFGLVFLDVQAYANAQDIHEVKMKLTVTEASVGEIFKLIEERTNFTFVYSSKRVDLSRQVILPASLDNVGEILDHVASNARFSYRQVENTLMIRPNPVKATYAGVIGAIKGKVTDSLTNEALPGATVTITGTTLITVTDLNGEFLLRAPAGDVTLEVRYIGFDNFSRSVSVPAEGTVALEIKLSGSATRLGMVVITGVLQGQQRALNQQKSADNIKNVVSADQIGRFPDPNVAEALQRVPGVNIERDQGEGRYVLVRGLAPQFTNISINGEQIPSPEADVRYVALDAVPADQLASIEVSKALTPDMDGDAIGGSVNLITRTAQSSELAVNGSGLFGYNNLVQKANFQGALELSKRFLNNKLGIMLNASYYETDRGSDNWERDGSEFALRDYTLLRTRTGLSSTIDYKFNERNEVYFRTIYNRFTDREQRRQYVFVPAEEEMDDNEIERYTKDRLEKQIVTSLNAGGKHAFDKFNLDYELAYAEAIQDTPYDIEIGSVGSVDELETDFETNSDFPTFRVNGVANSSRNNIYRDNSIYEFGELEIGKTYAKDVNRTAKFNIGIPYKIGTNSSLLKFGAKARMKEKSYDITQDVFEWTGGDVTFPGFAEGSYTLEKFAGGIVDKDFLDGRYGLQANADPKKVLRHFNENRSGYALNTEDKIIAEAVEAYTATEDVYAAYAMTKIQMSKLMLLGGLRFEHTNVNYQSAYVVNESEVIETKGGTDYSYFLPQLHAKYQIDKNTNLRAAITRSYARPNFSDIVPSQEININEREGAIGNTRLMPVSATNLDLMGEHYFGNVGILSAGVFYKHLNDFIYSRRFDSAVYPGSEGDVITLTQSQNGDNAALVGFELAYQQNLTFLPGFLKGFSVYANYTYTSSNAKIQSRDSDSQKQEEIRLPGQAQSVGNLSLAYDLKRINVRLSGNFNGEYLSEVGEDSSEDLFVNNRFQFDATATVTITPSIRVFAEFLNITNQPFEVYQGSETQFIQREFYSWWSRVGVKFDF